MTTTAIIVTLRAEEIKLVLNALKARGDRDMSSLIDKIRVWYRERAMNDCCKFAFDESTAVLIDSSLVRINNQLADFRTWTTKKELEIENVITYL